MGTLGIRGGLGVVGTAGVFAEIRVTGALGFRGGLGLVGVVGILAEICVMGALGLHFWTLGVGVITELFPGQLLIPGSLIALQDFIHSGIEIRVITQIVLQMIYLGHIELVGHRVGLILRKGFPQAVKALLILGQFGWDETCAAAVAGPGVYGMIDVVGIGVAHGLQVLILTPGILRAPAGRRHGIVALFHCVTAGRALLVRGDGIVAVEAVLLRFLAEGGEGISGRIDRAIALCALLPGVFAAQGLLVRQVLAAFMQLLLCDATLHDGGIHIQGIVYVAIEQIGLLVREVAAIEGRVHLPDLHFLSFFAFKAQGGVDFLEMLLTGVNVGLILRIALIPLLLGEQKSGGLVIAVQLIALHVVVVVFVAGLRVIIQAPTIRPCTFGLDHCAHMGIVGLRRVRYAEVLQSVIGFMDIGVQRFVRVFIQIDSDRVGMRAVCTRVIAVHTADRGRRPSGGGSGAVLDLLEDPDFFLVRQRAPGIGLELVKQFVI